MDIEGSSLHDWLTAADEKYSLRLFVAGASPISIRAINNLRIILDEHLKNRYELEIVDIHQQPLLVKADDVYAVPLLIKKHPAPVRRLIGDMSDKNKVIKGLGLNSH